MVTIVENGVHSNNDTGKKGTGKNGTSGKIGKNWQKAKIYRKKIWNVYVIYLVN